MLWFNEGFTFRNFLVDAITIFVFVVTIWLLFTVFMDLFRRHDISGWGKAFWVIGLLIFPLLAVLAYLITQGHGMAERNTQQVQQTRDELRRVVGFSAADEIEKLDRLKKAGTITDAEFSRLRGPVMAVAPLGSRRELGLIAVLEGCSYYVRQKRLIIEAS